jgi:SAM-dependent methyltransferase
MHDTAMMYGKQFFSTYLKNATGLKIVDIGAQDVNGSLRSVAPLHNDYIGVDFAEGKGVDVILTDPYVLPFEDSSIDVIVSSSCYEHAEFFWLSFNEALRVLKPTGLLYINAPSNGAYHRFPVDCWRFYPDSGFALQNWGNRSGYDCALLESFIGVRKNDMWNDFVGVFVKDQKHSSKFSGRVQDNTEEFINGRLLDSEAIVKHRIFMQTIKFRDIKRLAKEAIKKLSLSPKSR